MKIGEICSRVVVIAEKDFEITEAAKLMRAHHVGSLVVVDDSGDGVQPIGIITDRDLVVEALAQEIPLDAVKLEDVMTRDPIIAREDDGVWETLQAMRGRGVRRSPVVDAQGLLVGLISVDDILALLAEELSDLVKLIGRGQNQERKARPAVA